MYVFDHIYKTGGTTFNFSYLPSAFDPDEVLVLRGSREGNREDLQSAMALSTEQTARLRLISGHNAGKLRSRYLDARFLTLVRDPVARAISSYLHAKYHEDGWENVGRRIQEQGTSLAQFVKTRRQVQRDYQSRILLGYKPTRWLGPRLRIGSRRRAPQNHAEIIATIGSRFHLVGYTEAIELFLFYLHVTEGFPLVLFNNRLVRQERATFQATAEDLAVIERYNQLDRRIYCAARMEFDRKVGEIWSNETEQFYRKYLEALELYRSETQRDPGATPVRWPR
jgi:Sulfotransferase family